MPFDDWSKRKAFVWLDGDWISLGSRSLSIGIRDWAINETISHAGHCTCACTIHIRELSLHLSLVTFI